MADLNPQTSYDSRQRIQQLWEFIQRDVVELESETDQPPVQIWLDFIQGDQVQGTQFFKDFMELFYITKTKIVENKGDGHDDAVLVRRIAEWRDDVKDENMMRREKKNDINLDLVHEGIQLFRDYESILIKSSIVQVITK